LVHHEKNRCERMGFDVRRLRNTHWEFLRRRRLHCRETDSKRKVAKQSMENSFVLHLRRQQRRPLPLLSGNPMVPTTCSNRSFATVIHHALRTTIPVLPSVPAPRIRNAMRNSSTISCRRGYEGRRRFSVSACLACNVFVENFFCYRAKHQTRPKRQAATEHRSSTFVARW
jgi:hypothetical protein